MPSYDGGRGAGLIRFGGWVSHSVPRVDDCLPIHGYELMTCNTSAVAVC
jgi:hypothetical protein